MAGMEISDARKLKGLQEENRKLRKLLAESTVDISTLKEMLGKTSNRARARGDSGRLHGAVHHGDANAIIIFHYNLGESSNCDHRPSVNMRLHDQ